MKKSVIFLFIAILLSMLSGCILSKTPSTNEVSMPSDDQMTFRVNVFPSNATYTWTLDGEPLSNSGSCYDYTAQSGNHILEVKAEHFQGMDVQTWNIYTPILSDPVMQLLDSLVTIPAGSFLMGSEDNEYGQAQYTTPVHQVTLQTFDIGKYEVTQAQYLAVMGTNPSSFQAPDYPDSMDRPVEYITWYDAWAFCSALSTMTGRTFTLPSEAQWEYAYRAGMTTLYSWGDSDYLIGFYAWSWDNSNGIIGGPYGTHTVGTRLPNPWGLYDMMGNVMEWCLDSWHPNYAGAPTDGSAWEPDITLDRMVRGGSWRNGYPRNFRSAARYDLMLGYKSDYVGFRVLAVR
jgi:formylglycine-generating enzyme required for sulfatase activity